MILKKIKIMNYRQLQSVELDMQDSLTVLAGPNNSGKTTLISVLKGMFCDKKLGFSYSDIPISLSSMWLDKTVPVFQKIMLEYDKEKGVQKIIDEMTDNNKFSNDYTMDNFQAQIQVDYDPDNDNIQYFADYLMDLDDTKHSFYFIYTYEPRDAIGDLPKLRPLDEPISYLGRKLSHSVSDPLINGHISRFHNKRDIELFKFLEEDIASGRMKYTSAKSLKTLYTKLTGKTSNVHKYYVLRWDEPSNLIPAHLFKDGLRHIHPDPEQARTITVREAARLQTFPDDYYFNCSQTDAFKMIGNAVPPLFAKKVAYAIYHLIQEN